MGDGPIADNAVLKGVYTDCGKCGMVSQLVIHATCTRFTIPSGAGHHFTWRTCLPLVQPNILAIASASEARIRHA